MAFPDTPLKIVTELEIDGMWQDISADVYDRDPVVITRGKANEGAAVDPGSCRLTLNNGTSRITGIVGRYSPRNPRSDLYSKFGRNTPLRVSVLEGGVFLDNLSGEPDLTSTPDATPVKITGDIDLRWEGETDWYASGAQMLIGKWGAAGNRSYHMRLENRALVIHTTQDGTVGRLWSMGLPENLPKRAALRATMDVDNGAGGTTGTFYWATSINGPWIQYAQGVSTTDGAVTIFNSTAPLTVAPQQLDQGIGVKRYPFTGRCFAAEVRSGIDGTLVASPNFETQADGTTAFTDSAGRAWSIAAGAAITNRRSRFVGEVSEWPTRWEAEGSDGYVPLVASGVLRRMSQGKKALASTLRRRIPSFKPLGYWPMEEGKDATSAGNAGIGKGALKIAPVNWASADTLASSDPLPVLASETGNPVQMYASIPAPTTPPTSWAVEWVYRHDTIHTTVWTHMRIISTGTVAEWLIQWGQGLARVIALDTFGTEIWRDDTAIGTDLWGRWNKVVFQVNPNSTISGQLDWQLIWTDVGGDSGAASGSYTGTVGRPVALSSPSGGFATELDGMALGHISAWGAWDSSSQGAYQGAIDGWAGETAGNRMIRLAGEEVLPLVVQDGAGDHSKVGPQYPDTILNILQDAADADGGILYENREDIGIIYRGRAGFYNQPIGLELDFNARGLITPVEPVDDDQLIRNDRTITRTNGGSVQAVLGSGRLSVQDPPFGVGTYDDSTTLNLFSDDLVNYTASWYLRMGTVDEARYPSIAVDLTRNPALVSAAADMEVGDRLTVVNPPEWLPPGIINQRVEGYQETLTLTQWVIDYNCAPHSLWDVATVDGRESGIAYGPFPAGKVDSSGTTLGEPLDTTETGVDVIVADGLPAWVVGAPTLSPNPYLDTVTTGWNASNGTIARVAAPDAPTYSEWALRFTPNGSSSNPNAYTTKVAAITGNQYTVSGWMRCATTSSVGLNLNWYTGASYTSTSNNSTTIPANTWKWFEATFTAPAGVDGMSIAAVLSGTPATTAVLLVQGATIRPVLGATNKPREFPFGVSAGGEDMRVMAIQNMADTFTGRTVASGWGTSDFGDAWTFSGGAATDYAVSGGVATHSQTSVNVSRYSTLPAPSADTDITVTVSTSALAVGGPEYVGIAARWLDSNNLYFARIAFNTNQALTLVIQKRVGGTQSDLTSLVVPGTHAAGTAFKLRFSVKGSTLMAKAWLASGTEPDWQSTATDTALTAAGRIGVRSILSSSSTNTLPVTATYDNFTVNNYQRFTVVRSLNGVVKSHSAGEPLSLTNPAIVAL